MEDESNEEEGSGAPIFWNDNFLFKIMPAKPLQPKSYIKSYRLSQLATNIKT